MSNEKRSTSGPKGPGRGPGRVAEKPKDFKKSMKKLISYAKKYIPIIIVVIILSSLSSILSIIGPNKLRDITNLVTEGLVTGIDVNKIQEIAIFLVIIYSLSAIFNYIQGYMMSVVAHKFSQKLRSDISHKINKLPLKYFDKSSKGDILSRVTNDVDTIGQTLHQSVGSLVSAVTLFLGSLIMMFYTNWIMAITAILSTLIGFSVMGILLGKSQKYFNQRQVELGKINGHIEEIYSSHNVVKAYNGKEEADKKFDELNKKLFIANKKSQFLSGLMQPLMGFIGNLRIRCSLYCGCNTYK